MSDGAEVTRAAALTGAAAPSTFRSERRLEPAWSGSFDHALAAAHQAAGRAISTRAGTRRLSCEQADPRPMALMPSAKHDAGALRRRRRSGTPACRYRSRPSRLDRPRRPGTRSARTGCLRGKFVVCRPKSRRSVGLRRQVRKARGRRPGEKEVRVIRHPRAEPVRFYIDQHGHRTLIQLCSRSCACACDANMCEGSSP